MQTGENVDRLCNLIDEQVRYMDKIVGDLQAFAQPLEPEHTTIRAVDLISSNARINARA